jgi:HSP20 family protein
MVGQQATTTAHQSRGTARQDAGEVPVRVYEGDGRLMVMAPLPGLEPPDISVTVRGDRVVIKGEQRGPRQDERQLHLAEWSVGPYHRELTLPERVDGARGNATYGNGVLVLALPKASQDGAAVDAEFRLQVIGAPRGQRVGHHGQDLSATTTEAHRQQTEAVVARARAGT